MDFTVTPVGFVRSTRTEPYDDGWDAETASIELAPAWFGAEALFGVETFSHVEVIYLFDQVAPDRVERGARRPRGNPDWPLVGIFAQRGKNRPNRIGATICRVVDVSGTTLRVAGLDAVENTPVLDIKPYMAEFGPRGEVHQPAWSTELMAGYWA
jgi:tRNA-Thr(GGU) m(6)t(6)A37 methyltransferase TsaA